MTPPTDLAPTFATSPAEARALELDPGLLDLVNNAIRQHINIKQVATASGRAGTLDIASLEVGDANIERVTVEGLSTNIRCGAAVLKNVRAILELHYSVRWSYDLKWLGSDSGTKVLGSKAKPIPLHDIRIPMLQDIAFQVPQTELSDIEASVETVNNINLGGGAFENLEIDDTRLPSDGFGLSGLTLGSLEIESFGVPAADARQLRIGCFRPDAPLNLPDITLKGIELPAVDIPDAGSDGAVSVMDIDPEDFEAPVFKIGELFKAVFVARPVLHLQIGELVLSELQASAAIDCVGISGLAVPVTINGVRMGDITLNQLSATSITI